MPKQRTRDPFRPGRHASALSEWALLPLRLFLGVTFTYAGLQKLANPNFFHAKSTISIQYQFAAALHTSPLHALLQPLLPHAYAIGLIIAYSELAAGLGTLIGLWTRVAAIGGAFISLNLFLTVSFHSSPYFVGADIVFLFAWLPFIVAGGGSQLSVDGWIRRWVAKKEQLPDPALVVVPFAQIQHVCGHFVESHCDARADLNCEPTRCPHLLGDNSFVPESQAPTIARRTLVVGSVSAAAAAVTAGVLGSTVAATGQMIGDAAKPSTGTGALTTPTTVAGSSGASGTLIGTASEIKVRGSATFTLPSSGDPGLLIETAAGVYECYDAVCPHMGCTVAYSASQNLIVCPCHGSEFQVSTGDVLAGPAPHGLTKYQVTEAADGNLYLQ